MYKNKHLYDLIVVGGGASGMMAAGRAAELGARVLLLEKNKELGRKLSISGGGRCNILNDEDDIHELLSFYGEAKQFLYSPFAQFGKDDTKKFFESRELPTVTEARKRAFPETQNAADVTETLEQYIRDNKVEIHFNAKVRELTREKGGVFIATTAKNSFAAKNVVLATGGLAAPLTGSTGDGFTYAQQLGHTVYEPNPNIVPLVTDAEWVHGLSGVSLSFMKLRFMQNEKVEIKKVGKILFTHFGISGPLVLNLSKNVIELLKKGKVTASIDLLPDTNEGELDKRILNLFEKNKNKMLKNIFGEILPKQMIEAVLNQEHLNLATREVNSVTKEERKELVKTIKNLSFPIIGTLGYDKAVIADGGVDMTEVDTKTMESKVVPGLYLTGDMLHINRPSGGYSLQLCWTTGYVAGSSIGAQKELTTE